MEYQFLIVVEYGEDFAVYSSYTETIWYIGSIDSCQEFMSEIRG